VLYLLRNYKLVESTSEARRLIEQGGVSIGKQKILDIKAIINISQNSDKILKIGKRRFFKLIALKK